MRQPPSSTISIAVATTSSQQAIYRMRHEVYVDDMSKVATVINADVLDAWFPPADEAQNAIRNQLSWIMRTSPPTRAAGFEKNIAEVRGVDQNSILAGGGSSALIFLAFGHWLNRSSRVLILDPTYGEYTHILEQIIQCKT